ncbi:MAG: hypothetical protein RI575_18405 [Balneolaceae bacterium]|nr:hypothetical protein [Balneolaceae bacterium]
MSVASLRVKKEADDFVDFLKFNMENNKRSENRKVDLAKGLIEMKEVFDELPEDFKDYRNNKCTRGYIRISWQKF